MKNLFFIVIVLGVGMMSCSSPDTKNKQKNQEEEKKNVEYKNREEATEDRTEQYNRFKLNVYQQLSVNEENISKLKQRVKKKKMTAKINFEKTIDDLAERNEDMKEKIQEYQNDEDQNWDSFKLEYTGEMDELGQAFDKLTNRIIN